MEAEPIWAKYEDIVVTIKHHMTNEQSQSVSRGWVVFWILKHKMTRIPSLARGKNNILTSCIQLIRVEHRKEEKDEDDHEWIRS